MSEVIFINPPLSLKDRYGELALAGSMAPPFSLCNLAAVTREAGFVSEIIDAAALSMDYQAVAKKITEDDASYVGITATTLSIYSAAKVAQTIKELKSDIIVLVGGPHITALPEETMRRFSCFDIGVLGEGEGIILSVLKTLDQKRNWAEVKGIIFWDNTKLIKTEPQPRIKDLDSLPFPAWDLLPDLVSYYRPAPFNCKQFPAVSLITSRGCMAKCIFCSRTVFGNYWRGYSANYIIKMIRKLHQDYRVREIKIFDDNFVVSRDRVMQFCNLLKKEKLNLSWSCSARTDLVNPGMLKAMKEAGCWQIFYGIESGSQEILCVLNKRTKIDDIRHTIEQTRKTGIRVVGSFMIGNPLENLETIKTTTEFAKKLEIDDFQMSIFTPLPGSEIYENTHKYGIFDDDWQKMNLWYPVFVPYGLKKEDLWKYQKKAFREFYFRPRVILSYLTRIKSKEHIRALFGAVIALLKMQLEKYKKS